MPVAQTIFCMDTPENGGAFLVGAGSGVWWASSVSLSCLARTGSPRLLGDRTRFLLVQQRIWNRRIWSSPTNWNWTASSSAYLMSVTRRQPTCRRRSKLSHACTEITLFFGSSDVCTFATIPSLFYQKKVLVSNNQLFASPSPSPSHLTFVPFHHFLITIIGH